MTREVKSRLSAVENAILHCRGLTRRIGDAAMVAELLRRRQSLAKTARQQCGEFSVIGTSFAEIEEDRILQLLHTPAVGMVFDRGAELELVVHLAYL